MLSLKQLWYALAVEKNLHFKKAANQCNVSQSTLSTGITELEKQLGITVFERDNKKVLITPMGKEVLLFAREIILKTNDLQKLADGQKAPLSYPLTVGVIPTIAPFLLPKVFPVLHQQYPKAQLNIVEQQSAVLVDMVQKGEIDTAILALPFPHEGLLNLEFWQEDFYWVAQKTDQLTQQTEITSNEILNSNLMLLAEGHCLKDHIFDVCQLSEQTANHGFGATSLNTLVQMVMGNLGTTLIPQMALQQLIEQNPTLSAVHLNEPSPHRKIACLIRPNYTRMSSIEALIAVCKKALNE